MNITSRNRTSGVMSVDQQNQSTRDSHEITIQKQIVTLQEKMRNISYDSAMSAEEKTNEKQALQEKIQSLNSELKQYQIRKRQEEAEKRQKEAEKKQAEEAKQAAAKAGAPTKADSSNAVSDDKTAENAAAENAGSRLDEEEEAGQSAQPQAAFNNTVSGTMISISNTKEHLSNMQKIRTDLEGQLRNAATDEEKSKIQKKINHVTGSMGSKMQKISSSIADTQKEDKARKEKVKEMLKDYRDRMKNVNASVPKAGKSVSAETTGYWKDTSAMPGKVLITRKKT